MSEPYLQSTTPGHRLICIEGGAQLFAKEFADPLLDSWNSGGSAHNLHGIEVFLFQLWKQSETIN